jgi:hypothetical protein
MLRRSSERSHMDMVTREEFDDLRAQVIASNAMIVSFLIVLKEKGVLTREDIEILTESTLASMTMLPDPIFGLAMKRLEDFREAALGDEDIP